jgi:hypothetical protein
MHLVCYRAEPVIPMGTSGRPGLFLTHFEHLLSQVTPTCVLA